MRFFIFFLLSVILTLSLNLDPTFAKSKKNKKQSKVSKNTKKKSKYTKVVAHYRVEPDDTLATISIKLYGTTRYASYMYLWNKDKIHNMNQIEIGMDLKLKKEKIFSKEAGEMQLYYYYRNKFGLTGPPQIARANVGNIQELTTTTIAPPPANLATLETLESDKKKTLEEDPVAESVLKGEQLLKQNNLAEAKAEFAEARNEDPSNPTPRILEISTLLRMGNEAEAKERAHDLANQNKEFCDLPIIKRLAGSEACP